MQQIQHATVLVDSASLRTFCRQVLAANGVPEPDAERVGRHLVETNLRGIDSHGVARLPHYVRRLQAGSIRARPTITFTRLAPAAGRVDGGHGLGHLVMQRAAEEAAALVRNAGAGWVCVTNSSHCGALAPFGLWLADRGLIGLVFSHVDPMVLPYGARQPFCGTNPLCITAPGHEDRHLCLDMATSIVPWNVVANAARESVPISPGWGVDEDGEETTDPGAVHALYPFGGHRGSGLGIMIDVLCALLGGAPLGPDIPKMYGDLRQPRQLGGLVGAISTDAFGSASTFRHRVADLMARLGALAPEPGTNRVRFPGEPELESRHTRLQDGIPIGVQTLAELNELARRNRADPLVPRSAPPHLACGG